MIPEHDSIQYLAREMIDFARQNPCREPTDCGLPSYSRMIGEDIRVSMTLEMFGPFPHWHASVSGLHEIMSDTGFGMPERAILNVQDWSKDTRKIADEILGYLIAPLDVDKHLQGQKLDGAFSVHWMLEAHPKTWLSVVNYG